MYIYTQNKHMKIHGYMPTSILVYMYNGHKYNYIKQMSSWKSIKNLLQCDIM